MNERPTPETDANLWASIAGCIRGQNAEPIESCYVPALFARNLERQRDELLAALENYSSHSLARAAIASVKGQQ